jgi:uncharacterized membrane protein YgdD (TMEM256/DUF423 family)
MAQTLIALGAVLGFVGVAAGAFGAHALRARLGPDRLANWKTAADYELWHALATVGAGLAATQWDRGLLTSAGWCFVAGIVVFSGSLYVLAWTGQRRWGAVTPVGGVLFLVGWALLAIGVATA